jgi:hypothetical protein
MLPLQLIMQPIWKGQIQALDPVWMKIVYKAADFLPQESQNLLDSQLFRLEGSDLAGVHEVHGGLFMVISATETMSHFPWSLCRLPWAALQAICNVSCVFAGSRPIITPSR